MNILRKMMVMVLGIRMSLIACRIRRRDFRSKKFQLRTDVLVSRYYRLKMVKKDLQKKLKNDK